MDWRTHPPHMIEKRRFLCVLIVTLHVYFHENDENSWDKPEEWHCALQCPPELGDSRQEQGVARRPQSGGGTKKTALKQLLGDDPGHLINLKKTLCA